MHNWFIGSTGPEERRVLNLLIPFTCAGDKMSLIPQNPDASPSLSLDDTSHSTRSDRETLVETRDRPCPPEQRREVAAEKADAYLVQFDEHDPMDPKVCPSHITYWTLSNSIGRRGGGADGGT